MKNLAFILVICLLVAGSASGQSPRRSMDTTGVSSFATAGIRYRSDYYYMGRSDSVKIPYLIPSIAYYHKSGIFISGTLSYLTLEGSSRVDLFTLSGGYEYFGRKVATGISVDQYFFSAESNSVQAEMSTFISGYLGYDLSALMVIADASVGVSERFDFFLGGEISRTFYLLRGHLLITPSFYTNLGTQRYYNEYYTQRTLTTGGVKPGSDAGQDPGSGSGDGSGSGSGSGNGSGSGGDSGSGSGSGDGSGSGSGDGSGSGSGAGPGSRTAGNADAPADLTTITDISILESDKFQVLDYELGLQMSYKISRFRFSIAGTFLFPVNPSKVVTNMGTYEEDLENGFYWSAGIRYRIGGN